MRNFFIVRNRFFSGYIIPGIILNNNIIYKIYFFIIIFMGTHILY